MSLYLAYGLVICFNTYSCCKVKFVKFHPFIFFITFNINYIKHFFSESLSNSSSISFLPHCKSTRSLCWKAMSVTSFVTVGDQMSLSSATGSGSGILFEFLLAHWGSAMDAPGDDPAERRQGPRDAKLSKLFSIHSMTMIKSFGSPI